MLYEKYRPNTFDGVIGQGLNADILKLQVATGKLAHTYLFEGNRGSGKTTTARILAKAVNCENPSDDGEPCGHCKSCIEIEQSRSLDVVEIDAASNNGVDNVRDIIEAMKYAPEGKKKVYIIDEAHMLTINAFNAFLKLLEEPPEYGMFILCTTDKDKLPITILSRCQRFVFKRISVEDIVTRLRLVNNTEMANIEDKALTLIAKLADGAMRDALSILEQVISAQKHSYSEISSMLGFQNNDKLFLLIQSILNGNSKDAIEILYGIDNIDKIAKKLNSLFRALMLILSGADTSLIQLVDEDIKVLQQISTYTNIDVVLGAVEELQKLDKLKNTSQPGILLEMTVIKMCLSCRKIVQNNQVHENVQHDQMQVQVNENVQQDQIQVQANENVQQNQVNENYELKNIKEQIISKIGEICSRNQSEQYMQLYNDVVQCQIKKEYAMNKIYIYGQQSLIDLEKNTKFFTKFINKFGKYEVVLV